MRVPRKEIALRIGMQLADTRLPLRPDEFQRWTLIQMANAAPGSCRAQSMPEWKVLWHHAWRLPAGACIKAV